MSTEIPILRPGESVKLKLTVNIGEPNPDWHIWCFWRPLLLYREATEEDLRKLAQTSPPNNNKVAKP